MKDKLFGINFKMLAVLWLPTFLRENILLNFCYVLINPLEKMYLELLKARKQNLIRVNYNYQKFSIQKRLNNAFDPVGKRIEIVKAVQYEGIFTYTKSEIDPNNPNYFSGDLNNKIKWVNGHDKAIYLRSKAELYSEYDFIVLIPDTNINLLQLKAEIDYYILPSKNYQIIII